MKNTDGLAALVCVVLAMWAAATVWGDDKWPDGKASLEQMKVPNGFRVNLFAAEPDVVNPIAIDFDHRGRMYVLEALEYPVKAANEQKGRDRIRILEDTDGDHVADRFTLFADGLNLASGIAVGHGGVFVGQPPYLLFLEDTDEDDRADQTSILLDGWAYEDTHETLNSLMWGPDGWLYGSQGIMHESNVRGKKFNAAIWRYHPKADVFEVFAEGTNNPWGLDYDENGSMMLSTSVIPHLYHVIPGGFHKHPKVSWWSNPYAYGEIETIVDHRHFPLPGFEGDINDHRFGGGHAHSGLLIYQGGSFPNEYQGRAFLCNLHGNRINRDRLSRNGATYVASHASDFLLSEDPRFRGIHLKSGPDGSMFVLDWHDTQICHNSEESVWDRSYGRIYKIVHESTSPTEVTDVSSLPTPRLVELLRHRNSWWWRQALLVLAERGDQSAVESLKQMVRQSNDYRHSLRSLWALFVLDALDERFARQTLTHQSPWVRSWAIRFLGETNGSQLSQQTWKRLRELAFSDNSPEVRLQLACSCARWRTAKEPLELLKTLMKRNEDAEDPVVPKMVWVAFEPNVCESAETVLKWLTQHAPNHPMIRDTILPWTLRRLAENGDPHHLNLAVTAVVDCNNRESTVVAIDGLLTGLQGRQVKPPASWKMVSAVLFASPSELVQRRSWQLGSHWGDGRAIKMLVGEIANKALSDETRKQAIDAIALARRSSSVAGLLQVVVDNDSEDIRRHGLQALGSFSNSEIADSLLGSWDQFPKTLQIEAISLLISRRAWAADLLDAMAGGTVDVHVLNDGDVRRILNLGDPKLNLKVERIWGKLRTQTPANVEASLTKLRRRLRDIPGDRAEGLLVFEKNCMVCHRLHGKGHDVGPELTGGNRRDPEYLLVNIVDPSRVVGRAYYATTIVDTSGRVHTGILANRSAANISLKGQNGKTTVLARNEIDEMTISEKSLMPDGLPDNMTEQQFSDLTAYLMEDLHLTNGLISTTFTSSQPLDTPFSLEQVSDPRQASMADWQPFQIGPAGQIEISQKDAELHDRPPEGCRYVSFDVVAEKGLETYMDMAYRMGIKVWVNGKMLHRQNGPSDRMTIPVRLRAGQNQLLFKVSNIARDINSPAASGTSWLSVKLLDPQRQLSLPRDN